MNPTSPSRSAATSPEPQIKRRFTGADEAFYAVEERGRNGLHVVDLEQSPAGAGLPIPSSVEAGRMDAAAAAAFHEVECASSESCVASRVARRKDRVNVFHI